MKLTSLMMRRCVSWPMCNSSLCSACLEQDVGSPPKHFPTMTAAATKPRVLVYILRHDVRLSDNPIFHAAYISAAQKRQSKEDLSQDTRRREDSLVPQDDVPTFTHLLPIYIFPAHDVEVSGFVPTGAKRCPYPEARSRVAGVWRTGPHRARFMAQGVWNLKNSLENLGCNSGLEVRVGMVGDVVEHLLDWYDQDDGTGGKRADVIGIWITSEEGTEEKDNEAELERLAEQRNIEFKVWNDEKYYVDEYAHPLSLPRLCLFYLL
jgi:deoxyribodipyrimidine photo-lyase